VHVILIRPTDPLQHVQILSHTRPVNIAYLAAYLREHGIGVTILDYEVTPYSDAHFAAVLDEKKPALVGVSCMTPTINGGAGLCAFAKSIARDKGLQPLVTVVGGPHANGIPVQTLEEFPAFDYLVYGEGEVTLLELCRRIQDGGDDAAIDGLVFRRDGEVVQNPPRALIEDLDSIPFPARDLIEYGPETGHAVRGVSNSTPAIELFTSRGCPIGCSFCAIQTTIGNRARFRDVASVERELRQVQQVHPFTHLIIADDTFTLKQDRAMALCEAFQRNGIRSWSCDTRANAVSKELLDAMKKSHCLKVAFGVESGSQRIIDRTGKKITIEQVEQAVRWAKESGIKQIEGNFIIGADPCETPEEVDMTRKLICSLPWTFVSVSIIVPYPGTRVYQTMKEKGMLHEDYVWQDFVMLGKPPKWHTEHFSADDLVRLQRELTRKFYLRPRFIARQLASIRSWPELRYWLWAGTSYLAWYASREGFHSRRSL